MHRGRGPTAQAGDLDLAIPRSAPARSAPACWNADAASTRPSTRSTWSDGLVEAPCGATGITEDGGREVLGLVVGDSETEVFWSEFLRSLRARF
ncbi:transposase [Streptomyces sp. NPDC058067]|uniref:transposase n=1 Tax=Streptomyces sp. NPDC058067 TaxID=3346324 RepID=UPI0036F0EBA8